MRILNKNRAKESGVILVTVVILTIILSIVAIGVMSLNVSQIKTSGSVVKTIVAEQLATGLFYQDYQRRIDAAGTRPTSVMVGLTNYVVNWSADTAAGAPQNDTNLVRFNITY